MNILTNRAHCGHQYELWKLPHNFTCVTNLNALSNTWNYTQRPLHEKIKFIDKNNINPKDYDLCIIHFDEFCVEPINTHMAKYKDMRWGDAVKYLIEEVDLPKIAICHGTPRLVEQENINVSNLNKFLSYDENHINKTREFFKDVLLVICNSHQAEKEWNFYKSKTIWHGFDPNEFISISYQSNKVYCTPGATIKGRPWYNGYFINQKVSEYLKDIIDLKHHDFTNKAISKYLISEVDLNPYNFNRSITKSGLHLNAYAIEIFKLYRETLGNYSICFNSTLYSPMPRNRGEAMMSGLAIVTTDNHDVSMFIDNEKNGFYSNDPKELAYYIRFLYKNPKIAKEIGQNGRKNAIERFSINRFLNDWEKVLNNL